jgi:FHS family L-fucose permease-like MFS transporter
MKNKNGFLVAFILVTSLFFLWAFLHNINPILIPHLKKACRLTDTESALIDSSVYLGYFFVALPAGWFMHRFGYVKGIYLGLALYCIGAFLFIPAAGTRSYAFFLFALFIMAGGATFLETVANPYVTKLGDPSGAAQRLNFAQSFNGVGAFIAPLIGGQFILSGIEHSEAELAAMPAAQLDTYLATEAAAVKMPYLAIGGAVLLILLFFLFVRIPEIKERSSGIPGGGFSLRVLRHKHLRYAIIAEFCYVGAQVCVGSFFIRYAKFVHDIPEKDAAFIWGGIAMVGFMVGRFAGTFLMKYFRPAALLYTFALINIFLLVVALFASSEIAVYAVVATPFFMSIMFPTIFALGIAGLGEETKIASSLLVMSIVGGAFFPLIMGNISDATGSIQVAYVVPLFCFLVILWFGFTQRKTVVEAAPADAHALQVA